MPEGSLAALRPVDDRIYGLDKSARLLAERSVPRYTSYPTALQFGPSVDARTYTRWLAELSPESSLSLYLHVPYCAALCHYCGCQTKAVRRREPVEGYSEHLLSEIRLVQAATAARRVRRIHWGGGTPSILGPERLLGLAAELSRRFDLQDIGEHAIELDPRYVTSELANALARIGVTRASLGVQDLSPHVQEAIGRIQPFETVSDAVAQLRKVGIRHLNFDLMYGLPRQSVEDAVRSTELAISLGPTRLATFGYAHVPRLKPHQRLIATDTLPGAFQRLTQFQAMRDVLIAAGYEPIGLDHFARPDDELAATARTGRLRRNFQGYTSDDSDALIGLGASAIGRLPQGYVQNRRDAASYGRSTEEGKLPTARGLHLSADDRMRGHIVERLMCDFAVDLSAVEAEFGVERGRFDPHIDALEPLTGLVQVRNRRVTVTSAGRPFVRIVAAEFDAYLRTSKGTHSRAV